MLYGIGGAPEGVISAAIIRVFGGGGLGRLLLRSDVKGSDKNNKISEDEKRRCEEAGVEVGKKLLQEMVKTDEIIFSATGITSEIFFKG